MRDDADVGHLRQPRLHLRLVFEYVQSDAEIGVLAAVLDQSRLIDNWASTGVHQDRVLLHQGKPLGIHEVVGGLVQRRVQAHHIRLAKKGFAINKLCVLFISDSARMYEDFHAKGPTQPSNRLPYGAVAHQPQRKAVQFH